MKAKKILLMAALTAAVFILPSKALYISGTISPEAAKAFKTNVTDKYTAAYGACSTASTGYFQGLANVILADFNGDGTAELYVAYCSNPKTVNAHVNMEEIWSFSNGAAIKVASSEIANFSTDVAPETKLLTKDGTTLLIQGKETASGNPVTYRKVDGTGMTTVMTYTYPSSGEGSYNNVSMSRDKVNNEVKKFEAGGAIYDVVYVSSNASSNTLKQDTADTIALLNARATRSSAKASTCKMTINSTGKTVASYLIAGNNYVKLRDIASLMSGTSGQFDVGYNASTGIVSITTGKAYTKVGGELAASNGSSQMVYVNALPLTVNGVSKSFTSSLINGNNYIKLRDLGKTLNFYVGYEAASSTVIIDTSKKYTD